MKRITAIILASLMLLCMIPFGAAAAEMQEYKLKAGETISLSVSGTKVVSAKSSAPEIAKVKGNEITALTKGTAVVTATLENGETIDCNITVTSNPKIVGKKTKAEKFITFSISVKGAATKVRYSSSKPAVASITSEGDITTKKVGTATIKAKVNGKTLSFKLRVYEKKIVNNYKATFKKGYTYTLNYSEVGKNPKIVSGNSKIVKVTKGGALKALKRGKTTVTFSKKNVKAVVKITVK